MKKSKNKEKVLVIKIGKDVVDDLETLKMPQNVDKYPDNVVYFKSFGQFSSLLSERRLELLKYLSEVSGITVTKIATELHRQKEAVSRDLHELSNLGFIEMIKKGTRVYPRFEYQTIQINLKSKKKK